MKKNLLVIACLVLVLSISLILPFASVSADYVDDIVNNPQAIVNFNQFIQFTDTSSNITKINDNSFTFSTLSSSGYVNCTSFTFIQNHTYFIKSNFVDNKFLLRNGSTDVHFVNGESILNFTYESVNINNLYIFSSATPGTYFLGVYDLSQMFGENNIPSLDECRNIFTADYYPYNTGTPMTYNTIDAYNNGVNAYLGSQEYTISSLGFINSVYPVILNQTYGCETELVTYNTSQGYVQVGTGSAYSDPTLCLPFNYTIPAGTQITIKGKCSTTQYNASYSMHVGFWGNGGDMIVVPQGMVAGTQGYFRSSTITFTLPMSVDRIYLIVTDDATWQLKDFEVGYYLTNADVLRELGYKDGVAYMEKLYAPTGAYYQAIYQLGYNAGHDAPTYTFKDLIVASVDTPIQAFISLFDFDILGVNMKTFYLSIFTMCVIFVVLKLVL